MARPLAAAVDLMAVFRVPVQIAQTLQDLGLPPQPLEWITVFNPPIHDVLNRAGASRVVAGFNTVFAPHFRNGRNVRLRHILGLLAYTLAVSYALDRLTPTQMSALGDERVSAVAVRALRWVAALRQESVMMHIGRTNIPLRTYMAYLVNADGNLDAFTRKEQQRIFELYMARDVANIAMQYRSVARRKPLPKKVKKTTKKPRRAGKLSARV